MPTAKPRNPRIADVESTRGPSAAGRPSGVEEAQLLARYAPVVLQIAGGFQRRLPRNVLRDDLVAAGMSGLWDAILKHGRERGESFDWYVRVRVRGAILDELRAQDWLPRRARAAAAQAAAASGGAAPSAPVVLRFDDVSETEQARCLFSEVPSGEQHLVERHTRAVVAEAVERLPERERHIVSLHYFKGVKFKELGKMLGVSEPRISQLHSRAMDRLKVMLAQEAA
jgi:RNA polymerase sigma factor for flagellar operon FliA